MPALLPFAALLLLSGQVPAGEPAAPASPEQERPDPCLGREVEELALEGCAGRPCGETETRRRLLSLTDFAGGGPLDATRRDRGTERLLQTGLFQTVGLRCVPLLRGGQKVTLIVRPNRFVRQVDVEGNQFFRAAELSKFIFLRSGSILNVVPGEEAQNEDVQRLVATLQNFYRREGLEDVDIEVRAEPVGDVAYDLTVVIREGERDRLRAVEIHHDQQLQPAAPGEPECPRVDQRRLEKLVRLGVGDVVTSRSEERIRKRLETFLRSVGYVQPTVQVQTRAEPTLTLDVRITTRQCWLLRVWQRDSRSSAAARSKPAFQFPDTLGLSIEEVLEESPYDRIDFEDWREVLPFVESGVFHYEEALRGVEKIVGVLQARGLLFSECTMEHRRLPRPEAAGRQRPVVGTIDYLITGNYERRLQSIHFPGRRSFIADVLLGEMETHVYDFFDTGGVVRVDELLFDLTKIQRFYQHRGFYDFRYELTGNAGDTAPRRTLYEDGEWLVWEYRFQDRGFRVRKRKSEMLVHVDIPLVEGPRTRVGRVDVIHNDVLDTDEARALVGLVGGGRYGTRYLDDGLKRLRRWYQQRGYHRARLNVTCEAFDPEPWDGLCDPTNVRSRTVDVVVAIDEGTRSVLGEIFVRGNFKTDPDVLVRDLPEPGQPYDDLLVTEAVRELRNLGVFSAVNVERIGIDEEPPRDRVAVVVAVEEATTRFIDLAFGFRTIDREADRNRKAPAWLGSIAGHLLAGTDRATTGLGRGFALSLPDVLFSFEFEFLDLHLRGLGHQLRLPLKYGVSFTDPLRLVSFTPSIEVPRVLDSPIRLAFELVAEIDHVNDRLNRTELGVASKMTWPLRGKRMSLGLGLDLSVLCFEDPDLSPLCFNNIDRYFSGDPMISQEGVLDDLKGIWTPQVRPSVIWRWDTQDNPLNPTEGFVLTTSLKYILGLDQNALKEHSDLDVQSFVKWEASAEFAYQTPVGPIFAGLFRYGGSQRIGGAGTGSLLPINERFTLGGTNGLRGFGDHEVGRYGADGALLADIIDASDDGGGNVMVNASLESRIPIYRQLGIWIAVFLDAGALAAAHEELHPGSFRVSAGLGLRYLIGGQIPVRLDWAVALDGRRCVEWGDEQIAGSAKDCPRRENGNAFHFDLLYPF